MKKHRHGFTLAEVLITLVIIGIIAAMTIPTLMNKTNEQETVVAVKRAYATLGQAWLRIKAEYGEINIDTFGENSTKKLGELFATQLNVQKNCGISGDGDCWSTANGGMYKFFDGSNWINWNANTSQYLMRLSDGSSLSLFCYDYYTDRGDYDFMKNVFGAFFVDVNGDKGPNTCGKDVFAFWLTTYGIFPYGSPTQDDPAYTLSTCRTTGRGCTGWVLIKGNMDYLRKDVSW